MTVRRARRRLSGLDTAFLALDGPASVGHLVLLLDVDGALDPGVLRSRILARVPHHPLLRRRLTGVPLGLGRPFWTEVPPDLEDHLFSSELPDGLDLRGLAGVALSLVRRPLPRERPLWRLDLLRTPSGARTVVALSVHHATADGLAVRDLTSELLDPLWDQDCEPAAPTATSWPLSRALRWGGVLDLPAAAAAAAPAVAGLLPSAAASAAAGMLTAPLAGESHDDRRVLHGSVGADRSLVFGQVPLAAARVLRSSHGATVNDVVLAATAGALRRYLGERGETPRRPLHVAVPASRPGRDATPDDGANRYVLLRCPLPVHEKSREGRLEMARASMRARRERPDGDGAALEALTRFAVPAVATPALGAATRLGLARRLRMPVDLMVSIVPLPPVDRTIAGLPVRAVRPVPLVAEGLGLNLTVHGYADHLFYSALTSPRVLTDTERLVALVEDEHAELAALAV